MKQEKKPGNTPGGVAVRAGKNNPSRVAKPETVRDPLRR